MATDLQLAVLSAAVYSDEEPKDGPAAGFHIYRSIGKDESGLGASLYTKKTEVHSTAAQGCFLRGISETACPQALSILLLVAGRQGPGGLLFQGNRFEQRLEPEGADAVRQSCAWLRAVQLSDLPVVWLNVGLAKKAATSLSPLTGLCRPADQQQ